MSSEPPHSIAKPSSPPPAYTEIAEPHSRPDSTHQYSYGPTPTTLLQQQTHVIPYYDPRSDYSIREAVSRARWRFVGAVAWAIVILAVAGLVTGIEARFRLIAGRWFTTLLGGYEFKKE